MKILSIDIGGSGVKSMISRYNFLTRSIKSENVILYKDVSFNNFRKWFSININEKADILAISVPGYINYHESEIVRWAQTWKNYRIIEDLKGCIRGCKKYYLLNDAESHAYALMGEREKPVMVLSLGTSIGFSLISKNGELLRDKNGFNLDIGGIQLNTTCSNKEVWYCCGSFGLNENIEIYGLKAGVSRFGCRLGSLIVRLYDDYRFKTVVLTGGIIQKHGESILQNSIDEIKYFKYYTEFELKLYTKPKESALMGIRDYVIEKEIMRINKH